MGARDRGTDPDQRLTRLARPRWCLVRSRRSVARPTVCGMGVDYVCEYCGFAGHEPSEDDADRVQCSQCGELVVSLPAGSGMVTDWPE